MSTSQIQWLNDFKMLKPFQDLFRYPILVQLLRKENTIKDKLHVAELGKYIIRDSNKRRLNEICYQKEFVLITIVVIEVVSLTPEQKCRHFSDEKNYLKRKQKHLNW